MNRITSLFLSLLVAAPLWAATGPKPISACDAGCEVDKEHCVAKLGEPAEGNCSDGMQICLERCNPRGQISAAIESARERQDNKTIRGINADQDRTIRLCTQKCDISGTLCTHNNSPINECALGRQACMNRCYEK